MSSKNKIKKSALIPTVLISGGAGFIGSHLAEKLLDSGARVVILDNFSTGKEIHVKHLLDNEKFALYNVDISKGLPSNIESVDYIFHLASLEEYLFSKDFLNLDALLTNSQGTKNLLDLAQKSEAKFLLVSTIDVYIGRMSQIDIARYFGDISGVDNKFSLVEAKRFAEAIVWEYHKKFDTDVRIARLPEVYGPRMSLDSSGALGSMIKDLVESQDLRVYGDGIEKEYYLYIKDAVSGLVHTLFDKNTKGNIYSLVPDNPVSVLETAYLLKSLADGDIDIKFIGKDSDYSLNHKTPDAFNLKDLKWEPKVKMKEGVVSTLKWFGYSPNPNTFKPNKLVEEKVEDKINSKVESPVRAASFKPATIPISEGTPSIIEHSNEHVHLGSAKSAPKDKKFKKIISKASMFLKRIKLPKINFRFKTPSFNFFDQNKYLIIGVAIFISAFSIFIILPSVTLFTNLKKSNNLINSIQQKASLLDSSGIQKDTAELNSSLRKTRISLHRLKPLFVVFSKEKYNSYDYLLSSLQYFNNSIKNISIALEPIENLWEVVRPDTDTTIDAESFEKSVLYVNEAKKYLEFALTDLSLVNPEVLPKDMFEKYKLYETSVQSLDENLNLLSNILVEVPSILGSQEQKTYLIWFQNSNEIRPTGGFIGSYGLLTFNEGKLKNLVIDDIYNPDGQIDVRNIQVEPPKPISDFLKEDRLYLRNSNWNPDFTKSANDFQELYYKITGEIVDGVIAVDLSFVKSLLDVTGPIYLAAYNEEINTENLYERTQYYTSFNYEEGSDQKRSFLTVLGSKMLERLFSLSREQLSGLSNAVLTQLDKKHLMATLNIGSINNFLGDMNWNGKLVNTDKDYLYIVDANLGGTKSDYFVRKRKSYEVNSVTRDGLLRGAVYLDYEHTGEQDSWPGGPYTNYVRVLTQIGSKLTSAKIIYNNGEEQDIFENIIINEVGNYNSYETSFVLQTGEIVRVVMKYDLPQNLSLTRDNKEYNLYWQKQPGTHDEDYSFVFNPPFGMSFKDYSDNIKVEYDAALLSGQLDTDRELFVKLK